jgi:GH25 family lysozyme M1 (1,4-beta-N-acetylmuramidase)
MLGIELSKWNGDWDAARAKSAGAAFTFIQASRSISPDPFFKANWSKAKESDFFRSAYHCLDNTAPASEQAQIFLELLDGEQGELPASIQLEEKSFETNNELAVEFLQEFIENIMSQGMTPIIGTSAKSWPDCDGIFSDWTSYPLWVADFISLHNPQIPTPWTQYTFWKYSETGDGETFGSESFDIPLINFRGTLADLVSLTKNTTTLRLEQRITNLEKRIHDIDQFVSFLQEPAVNPDIENAEMDEGNSSAQTYALCNANSLNIRSGPGMSHQVIGTLLVNQRVRVLERQDEWAHIQEPDGWISEKYVAFE